MRLCFLSLSNKKQRHADFAFDFLNFKLFQGYNQIE